MATAGPREGAEEPPTGLERLLPTSDDYGGGDMCSECGARAFDEGDGGSASPARGDIFGVDFTPEGSEDGFGILTFCSRRCLFSWARRLLAEVDGPKEAGRR